MASPPDRPFTLEFVIRSAHPALLQGLDNWLQLGLISDEFVRRVCAEQLVCLVPEDVLAVSVDQERHDKEVQSGGDFLPVTSGRSPLQRNTSRDRPNSRPTDVSEVPEPAAFLRPPTVAGRLLQSFMAELSVLWLLFLGVFLVVVSSGVLAATQWRNFSAVGQYSILLGYTIAFWLAGWWAGKQPSLQLTSRMLNLATLLIIPVNFWVMDGFRLGQTPVGLGMAAIASLLLTGILILILKPSAPKMTLIITITLSWLHWGWGWQGVPFWSVYLGTFGAAAALLKQDATPASPTPNPQPPTPTSLNPISLGTIALVASTLILIGRAVLTSQVPLNQVGLALGIGGWVLCWLARKNSARAAWSRAGAGLLLVGWLVAMTAIPPWQAIAVSGLALWLLGDRLRQTGLPLYLTAGFFVGLQTYWLLWQMVPPSLQTSILAFATQWAGPDTMPFALIGLGVFPYVLLTVWLSLGLRCRERVNLARHAEWLALGLGTALTAISLGNSTVRSLNLLLSALTLMFITAKRAHPEKGLIYLTHGVALAAIAAGIHWRFPTLSLTLWASILLAGMVAEWIFSAGLGTRAPEISDRQAESSEVETASSVSSSSRVSWQTSAWHVGLGLAGLSYGLLAQLNLDWDSNWGGIWLIVPLMLTLLGYQRRFPHAHLASQLSCVALLMVQPLMVPTIAGRLTSLGVATGLMLLNTRRVQRSVNAILTVGFGLVFLLVAAWEIFTPNRTIGFAAVVLAIAVFLLWLLRGWLLPTSNTLARLYQTATDGWAIAVTLFTLMLLTLSQVIIYLQLAGDFQLDALTPNYAIAAAILVIATSYRVWQSTTNFGFYAIAWSVELLLVSVIALTGRSLDALGIANLALGLVTQLAGDWWIARELGVRGQGLGVREEGLGARGQGLGARNQIPNPQRPTSNRQLPTPKPQPPIPNALHIVPLLFALLGVIIQHRTFTATTGLYTIAASLVGLGIGRRQSAFQWLTLLSLGGLSIALYELLLYQLLQAGGANAGDGVTLLAGLAIGLAIAYHLLQRWLVSYLRIPPWLWQAIAHAHWGLSSGLLITPLLFNLRLSNSGQWLWTGVTAATAAYALAMGRRGTRGQGIGNREQGIGNREQGIESRNQPPTPNPQPPIPNPTPPNPLWIYVGIFQSLITLTYWLHEWLSDAVLIDWAGAIAAIVTVFLYFAPWDRWGWDWQPWRYAAIALPGIAILLTAWSSNIQSLLIVAAFYGWLSSAERRVRLSYISVLLANWAILRMLSEGGASEPLWIAAVIGASILYIAQVDPSLRSQTKRETRHWLRCLAVVIICLTAFYQAQVGITGIPILLVGLGAIAIDLAFVFAGILLKIRALLYVGTATFMLQVLWQVWRFISDYSLVLWAIGIAVGLLLIWIAATFEARRSQVNSLLQRWIVELDNWQ